MQRDKHAHTHPADLEEDSDGDVIEMKPTRTTKRKRVHMEDSSPLHDVVPPNDEPRLSASGSAGRDSSGSASIPDEGNEYRNSAGKPRKETQSLEEDSLARGDLLIELESRQRASSTATQNTPRRTISCETPNGTPETDSSKPKAPPPPSPPSLVRKLLNLFLSSHYISWIIPRITSLESMKPVIRSAIAAWLGLIFLLVYRTEAILGQAAFFCIVVACICPPAPPFIQTIEQIFYLFLFVGTSWAWCVLAAFLSIQARTQGVNQAYIDTEKQKYPGLGATNPQQLQRYLIFDGAYLEAGSSAVAIIFLGILVAFFAWLKIKTAPAPWTFACVLACVLADVSLTIVPLFPTPYYTSGLLFMLPMSIQCGLNFLCSIFIFPQSVSSAFVTHLGGVIAPLSSATVLLEDLFRDGNERRIVRLTREASNQTEVDGYMPTPTFGNGEDERTAVEIEEDLQKWVAQGKLVRASLLASVAGLNPLKAKEHYLTKEPTFGRLMGDDLVELSKLVQVLQLRSGGIVFFFDVVSQAISHSHLDSKAFEVHTPAESRAPSRPASRAASRRNSREHLSPLHDSSPLHDHEDITRHVTSDSEHPSGDADSVASARRGSYHDSWHRSSSLKPTKKVHINALWPNGHLSLVHNDNKSLSATDRSTSHVSLLESLRKIQQPVGVYESQRYMNVEREQGIDAEHVSIQLELLAEAALPLVVETSLALKEVLGWLKRVNKQRSIWRAKMQKEKERQMQNDTAAALLERLNMLDQTLQDFKTSRRFKTMEPYLHLFDPSHPPDEDIDYRKLPHRALFWDCLATYHLIEYSSALRETMRKMQRLDAERSCARLWWPRLPPVPFFGKQAEDAGAHTDDADEHADELGDEDSLHEYQHLTEVKRRNPDAQPYGTPFLDSLRFVDKGFSFFTKRDFLFAVKAGLLTCLVALPSVIRSSAHFFYYNRGLWVIIMSQMTLALYAGETAVAWVSRAQGTFFGCLVGMVMWYVGSGSGRGNVYGLAAVCAVGFPMLFMIRIHYPAPPLLVIIFTVSAGLVVGYSWLNASLIQATNATWGWDVAWRRFVSVLIGITAAWIFAQLPPTVSGKETVRKSYARMISQIGTVWCDIISEANDEHMSVNTEQHVIRDRVLAMKRKLAKTGMKHEAIKFEFSLKGRWPIERYQALHDVCVDMVALLSQMHHVMAGMPYPWRRALLERVKLLDHRFLGECLAVITMCSTSLRAGTPLPQITPGPLVERLLERHYGVAVTLDSNETKEIPHHVTSDVLKSEEYLSYALGATTCFSIIRRFDKLLLIVKTLVGEDYHVALNMQEKFE